MRSGQQQLQGLKHEVAERDALVSELRAQAAAEHAAEAGRLRQVEARWEAREKLAQLEVTARVQVGVRNERRKSVHRGQTEIAPSLCTLPSPLLFSIEHPKKHVWNHALGHTPSGFSSPTGRFLTLSFRT